MNKKNLNRAEHTSLKSKLLLSTILTCTLIVIAVSLLALLQDRKKETDKIQEEFINFEQGASQAIREAVWRYDWEMVRTIVENQTSRIITFVEICDTEVSRCLQHGLRNNLPFLDYQAPIFYTDEGTGREVKIGNVYLQGHYPTLASYIIQSSPRLIFINVVTVFGIALILFHLFHRQVVQRLLALEQYTRGIDLQHIGSLEPPQPRMLTNKPDEIDLLAEAVGNLVERTNAELERRQNLEQQLNQVQKMEALGNLAGGIAHDFNNILSAILGFAELSSMKSEPGSEVHRNLEKIISAGQRARNLTSQILVFSRRTEEPREVLALAGVVEETLHLIRASLPASIKIETELDREVRIKGDSTRLHQVVLNIATNAAQAIGERKGRLGLRLKKVSLDSQEAAKLVLPPGSYGCLEIEDDGAGIPAEIGDRIFEPFYTTKKAGKGTGMGLAVVHTIIKNHGGAIVMKSGEEVGTCFTIYLPLTEGKVSDTASIAHIPRGKGEKILLVDDEQQVLDMGASILSELGYKTITFAEPESALAYLQDGGGADLIITDLTMPERSGVELAESIRAVVGDVPILLWTGYSDDIAVESLNKKIITRIIHKPFDMQSLATAVRQTLMGS